MMAITNPEIMVPGMLFKGFIFFITKICYKRGEYKGIPTMKSKHEDEDLELRELGLDEDEVLVDDYKDLELEIMAGSREKTLWWMKHYD